MEKIAIIDLGSNSARLVLVNILEGGHFVVFDELKESVRLGQDMDWDGFIKPQRIAQTIKTLTMFRRLCDANHVDKIFAYATAAVRRAKNQKSFLDEVAMTCGIKIKVLTVEEQAMLVYQGVINSMDIPKVYLFEFCIRRHRIHRVPEDRDSEILKYSLRSTQVHLIITLCGIVNIEMSAGVLCVFALYVRPKLILNGPASMRHISC